MKHRSLSPFLCILLLLALVGCKDKGVQPATIDDYLPLEVGGVSIEVQVALTNAEKAKGLMHRESLPADSGMLFVFDRPQSLAFYMRDTLIPLDIGYFDTEGVLKEIYQMYPRDETSIISRGRDMLYALEMNQGWYSQNDVKVGARINPEKLEAALERRRQTITGNR